MPTRKPVRPWHEVMEPAPGPLRVVQAFLNSLDRLRGLDELASPRALNDFLRRWGLSGQDLELGPADLERARTVRESLRALIRAERGKRQDETAAARLDALAVAMPLRVRFAADGASRFEGGADGLDGALAKVLASVAEAQAGGSWSRLKPCPGCGCSRFFYDGSRGERRRWCAMSVCGSRSKRRTYRGRHPDRVAGNHSI